MTARQPSYAAPCVRFIVTCAHPISYKERAELQSIEKQDAFYAKRKPRKIGLLSNPISAEFLTRDEAENYKRQLLTHDPTSLVSITQKYARPSVDHQMSLVDVWPRQMRPASQAQRNDPHDGRTGQEF